MSDLDLSYKIITLDLLFRAGFPLSNSQICDFFVGKGYTEYFKIQEVLNDLVETEMIRVDNTHGTTFYRITEEGEKTLPLFPDRITAKVEEDVSSFFAENQIEMKKRNSVMADYYDSGDGFTIHCKVSEEERVVIDLTLHASSKELAEAICTNWRVRYEDVYDTLIEALV